MYKVNTLKFRENGKIVRKIERKRYKMTAKEKERKGFYSKTLGSETSGIHRHELRKYQTTSGEIVSSQE